MKNELHLVGGEARKEAGRDRVEANNREWLDWARFNAREIAFWRGEITIDDIREMADSFGRQPTHPNAYGCVFRGEQWEKVGYRKSLRSKAHARVISVWALKKETTDE